MENKRGAVPGAWTLRDGTDRDCDPVGMKSAKNEILVEGTMVQGGLSFHPRYLLCLAFPPNELSIDQTLRRKHRKNEDRQITQRRQKKIQRTTPKLHPRIDIGTGRGKRGGPGAR